MFFNSSGLWLPFQLVIFFISYFFSLNCTVCPFYLEKHKLALLSFVSIYFKGQTLDDVPQLVIDDCAQLVKANSIQGIVDTSSDTLAICAIVIVILA